MSSLTFSHTQRLSLSPLLLLLILCFSPRLVSSSKSSKTPTKIGQGYRLIALEETPDGGLLGHLQVKTKNNVYGPDITNLQLYVK